MTRMIAVEVYFQLIEKSLACAIRAPLFLRLAASLVEVGNRSRYNFLL
jgi:hypothetical protein